MLVDYERAWLELKRTIGEKRSHGQSELAVAMADLEVKFMLDNDVPPPDSSAAKQATTDADQVSAAGMPSNQPTTSVGGRNGSSNAEHPVG